MKNILFAIIVLSLTMCISCVTRDNMGYPKSLYVDAKGDTIFLPDKKYWTIQNGNRHVVASPKVIEDDDVSMSVCEYDWLRVETWRDSSETMVIVKPNQTDSTRTLYLDFTRQYSLAREHAEIAIIQNACE